MYLDEEHSGSTVINYIYVYGIHNTDPKAHYVMYITYIDLEEQPFLRHSQHFVTTYIGHTWYKF
jgi:hypothetical protein